MIHVRPPAHPATFGGLNRVWPSLASQSAEVGDGRKLRQTELPIGRDHQMHWTLDLCGIRRRAIEISSRGRSRRSQRPEARSPPSRNVAAQRQPGSASSRSSRTKKRYSFAADVLGRDRGVKDDVDDVVAVERAGPSRGTFSRRRRGSPDRTGTRPTSLVQPVKARDRLSDVLLGVVAHPHREQLEQLAAEVLVRVSLAVLPVVQIHQHRRVPQNPGPAGHGNRRRRWREASRSGAASSAYREPWCSRSRNARARTACSFSSSGRRVTSIRSAHQTASRWVSMAFERSP